MNKDLRDLYQDLILDHGRYPRNFRELPEANREILGHNPLCGDKLTLMLYINEDGIIEDASFQGSGCAISMASASMMTEMIKGISSAKAYKLYEHFHLLCTDSNGVIENANHEIEKNYQARLNALSGVRRYPMRVKCAMLPWRALQAALDSPDKKSVKTE